MAFGLKTKLSVHDFVEAGCCLDDIFDFIQKHNLNYYSIETKKLLKIARGQKRQIKAIKVASGMMSPASDFYGRFNGYGDGYAYGYSYGYGDGYGYGYARHDSDGLLYGDGDGDGYGYGDAYGYSYGYGYGDGYGRLNRRHPFLKI